ncbi:isoleucyl-tRNA synthetase [Cutibacterium acnes JCM 18909]|nr:isoleucyl-tRNA synthetase [Cutibacterium acnes JCM 18909]
MRFPVTSGPLAGRAKLLVWTTTPWTLVSNTAVAVHPEVRYVVAHQDPVPEGSDAVATASAEDPASQDLIIAEPLFEKKCWVRGGALPASPSWARRWNCGPTSAPTISWSGQRLSG